METEIVYAEIESVTDHMKKDKNVLIISDTGLFLVCIREISKHYDEEFYPVPVEAIDAYKIKRIGIKVYSTIINHK